ncbi:MAG: hypothetical protein WEC12_00150 [Balneolaceae bacterium]
MSKEVTQERIQEIIEDATYLQDEAEALRYVIDSIPFDQSTPGDYSVIDKLLLLDHLQVNYYRPLFDQATSKSSPSARVQDLASSYADFSIDDENKPDILKVLGKLSKHRAALISVMRQIPLIDWEKTLYKDNQKISLYDFAASMVRNDRKLLKEIADTVMIFQKESQSRREIKHQSGKKNQNNH